MTTIVRMAIALALATTFFVPAAEAKHAGPSCWNGHGGDTDGDGVCDDVDTDDDNDGAGDTCDRSPKSYSDVDWVLSVVKGCRGAFDFDYAVY